MALLILFIFILMSDAATASEARIITQVDTLILAPLEEEHLPAKVISWLQARDFLIPLPWEKDYRKQYGNTLTGSFTGEGRKDCAVLVVSRGAIEDSCKLWVFPQGDTLNPMLVGTHKWNFIGGSHWSSPWGVESVASFAGRIIPYTRAEYLERLKNSGGTEAQCPKIDHEFILLHIVDKGGGWYYYYDGSAWTLLPGLE